jgi:hypothetical protein
MGQPYFPVASDTAPPSDPPKPTEQLQLCSDRCGSQPLAARYRQGRLVSYWTKRSSDRLVVSRESQPACVSAAAGTRGNPWIARRQSAWDRFAVFARAVSHPLVEATSCSGFWLWPSIARCRVRWFCESGSGPSGKLNRQQLLASINPDSRCVRCHRTEYRRADRRQ